MGVRARRRTLGVAGLLVAVGLAGCMSAPWSTNGVTAERAVSTSATTTDPPIVATTTAPSITSLTSTTSPVPTHTSSTTTVPTKTPTTSTTAKPSPSTTPTKTPTPTKPPAPRDYLRVGDQGPTVLALQKRLSALGYWLGTPDGQFGGLTQQAVWALQKAAGIQRDGQVGARTRAALADGVRPSATISNGIEINLRRQLLMVVRGGQVQLILNTSTGSGLQYVNEGQTRTAVTPRGTYHVTFAVDGPDDGPLGVLWRPRYFNGGIAVHGLGSVPPYPASHGCARVSNSAMDMIWARGLMPLGSTVAVR